MSLFSTPVIQVLFKMSCNRKMRLEQTSGQQMRINLIIQYPQSPPMSQRNTKRTSRPILCDITLLLHSSENIILICRFFLYWPFLISTPRFLIKLVWRTIPYREQWMGKNYHKKVLPFKSHFWMPSEFPVWQYFSICCRILQTFYSMYPYSQFYSDFGSFVCRKQRIVQTALI